MEPWQRDHILANFPQLVRDTNCNDLLRAYLLAKNILGSADEDILRELNGHSRNKKFYEILQTRDNSYMVLIEALKHVKQTGIVALLESGIPPSTSSRSPYVPSDQRNRREGQNSSVNKNSDRRRNNGNRNSSQTSSAPTAHIRIQNRQRQYTYRDDNVVITIKTWELQRRPNSNREPQFLCHIITQRGESTGFEENVMTALEIYRLLEDLNRQFVYPTPFISDPCRIVIEEQGRSQTVTFSYKKLGSIFIWVGIIFLVVAVLLWWPVLAGASWLGTGIAVKIFTALGITCTFLTGAFLGFGAAFLSMADD